MKNLLRSLLVIAAVAAPTVAQAQVINFEGTSSCNESGGVPLPANYAGFSWSSNSYVVGKNGLPGTGYQVGTNGCSSLFNGFGANPLSMSGANPFTFNSLVLTSAWEPQTVTITGWLGATLLFSSAVNVTTTSQSFVSLNWAGVDRIDFNGAIEGPGGQYVIDDINVNATPEPATLLLLAPGFAFVGYVARKRRQSA